MGGATDIMTRELSLYDQDTARFEQETLESRSGLDVTRPTALSLMARLHAGRAGEVLAIGADIDALAIQGGEQLRIPPPTVRAVHASGHDAHTAMLLSIPCHRSPRRARSGPLRGGPRAQGP